jgi:hypothetical protein
LGSRTAIRSKQARATDSQVVLPSVTAATISVALNSWRAVPLFCEVIKERYAL